MCGSPVVRVSEADANDRLICPICWAAGDYAEVMEGRAKLLRGTRIEGRLRVLVDRARFPKPLAPSAEIGRQATPLSPDSETADLAAATAAQRGAKVSTESN